MTKRRERRQNPRQRTSRLRTAAKTRQKPSGGTGRRQSTVAPPTRESPARVHGRRRGSRAPEVRATVGVIGGSGLYEMEEFVAVEAVSVPTPFGRPSDSVVVGRLGDTAVAFLPRHGRGHRIAPSELNFRANIYALKALGVEAIISVSAVGSLRDEIAPGHVVVPDQFIDRTRGRVGTFFGDGVVAHVSLADPVCPRLSAALVEAGRAVGATVHGSGTYLCMEGPQFSTRAESELYRSWGAHVIGMTNLQEAKLAREAEICFATLAMVTDYDCWKSAVSDVDVQEILRVLKANVSLAKQVISVTVREPGDRRTCACAHALKDAIITERAEISVGKRRALALLTGKYLS
jgi:5'-methylthioadenosine phosphorylase